MRDRNDDFTRLGADVIVVLCQKPANVALWLTAHPVPFRVVVDGDRSAAKSWGVYQRLSYDAIHIARPASFVVDGRGVLRWARISRHQADASPLDEVLEAVRAAAAR